MMRKLNSPSWISPGAALYLYKRLLHKRLGQPLAGGGIRRADFGGSTKARISIGRGELFQRGECRWNAIRKFSAQQIAITCVSSLGRDDAENKALSVARKPKVELQLISPNLF